MLTLMEREHRAPKFAGQLRRPKARKSMPRNEKRYIVSSYENFGPPPQGTSALHFSGLQRGRGVCS